MDRRTERPRPQPQRRAGLLRVLPATVPRAPPPPPPVSPHILGGCRHEGGSRLPPFQPSQTSPSVTPAGAPRVLRGDIPAPCPIPFPPPQPPGAHKGSEAMPQFVSQSRHLCRCLQRGSLLYLPPGTSPVLLVPLRPPRGGTQGCCTLAVSSRGGPGGPAGGSCVRMERVPPSPRRARRCPCPHCWLQGAGTQRQRPQGARTAPLAPRCHHGGCPPRAVVRWRWRQQDGSSAGCDTSPAGDTARCPSPGLPAPPGMHLGCPRARATGQALPQRGCCHLRSHLR